MPIVVLNPDPTPLTPFGGYNSYAPVNGGEQPIGGGTLSRTQVTQVVGLVPVFPCSPDDCRYDKFLSDTITNDQQFPLNVFAQTSGSDLYFNDQNSWLFELNSAVLQPSYTFFLDMLEGNTWVQRAALNDNTFGQYYCPGLLNPNSSCVLCNANNWTGYNLNWQLVLNAFGEGMYRFRTTYFIYLQNNCFASPAFCLKKFDCYKADKTTKFEAFYAGGRFGSIDKTNCGGKFWDFCCCASVISKGPGGCDPINWYDSIRIPGFFGREEKEYERNSIKYQNGFVNKIRDEAIRKFKWRNFSTQATNPGVGLPFWFHDRFSVYGLMADKLLVSDYNLNNADYHLNRYCVVADGNYVPEYKGDSRFQNVTLQFKSQTEYLIRTRCC
jgi:hypothetical protein